MPVFKSLHFAFYLDAIREKLTKTMRVEEINSSPNAMIIGHGHIQHTTGDCRVVLPTES